MWIYGLYVPIAGNLSVSLPGSRNILNRKALPAIPNVALHAVAPENAMAQIASPMLTANKVFTIETSLLFKA